MFAGLLARWIAPYAIQLAIGVGVVALAGGALWGYGHHKYNQGWAAAIAAVAAQDQRAVNAKDEAVAKVRACRDAGRTWSIADGVCE